MFDRFTEVARWIILLAQEEARGLNHDYIGTEHLMLGLICGASDDPPLAEVWSRHEMTIDRMRAIVRERVGTGDTPPFGEISFNSGARRTLEGAVRVAAAAKDDWVVAPGHLLLGWLASRDETATALLHDARIDGEVLVKEMTARLGTV